MVMKRFAYLIAAALLIFSCSKEDKPRKYNASDYEAVDLGLSVKWASMNLGATAPEDYGDYFAWGETQTKEDFYWNTYKWWEEHNKKHATGVYTKYVTYYAVEEYAYLIDNKTRLEPQDDAAHVTLGGKWRMPTNDEWRELRTSCDWSPITQNGVRGMMVSSKKTGKSIFLPYGGGLRRPDLDTFTQQYDAGEAGYYWIPLLWEMEGMALKISTRKFFEIGSMFRPVGCSIRAVCDD